MYHNWDSFPKQKASSIFEKQFNSAYQQVQNLHNYINWHRKSLKKYPIPIHDKALRKEGIKGHFFKLIKASTKTYC